MIKLGFSAYADDLPGSQSAKAKGTLQAGVERVGRPVIVVEDAGSGTLVPPTWPVKSVRNLDSSLDLHGLRAFRAAARSRSKRIYDFQKRELIEIGISGANSPNTVLAHENGRVRVVQQVTGKMR